MKQVLIVDDERLVGKAAARSLRTSQMKVKVVEDVKAALAELSKEEYDLVLSDFDMPEQDGAQFLENVQKEYPRVRRVLMSADPPESIADMLDRGTIEHFEEKPFCADVASRLTRLLSL